MLKSWIKRATGAAGVEYRLAPQVAAARSDVDRLTQENEELRRELGQLRARLDHVSRFSVGASWRAFDRIDEIVLATQLRCLACGFDAPAGAFAERSDECIFGGGRLIRHLCPTCGCVFGPQKYLTLPSALIDADYAQLYAAYAEADSTEGEIRTFRALEPKKGGVYLNWGCGAWSGAIDRLRAEGYDVWGYEPNADIDHPHVVKKRDQLSGPFDGVFSHNVIEHLIDPKAQFEEFAQLLKPEGRMAHASPCYEWSYAYTRFHVFFPMGQAAKALAERSGYELTGGQDDGDFRVRVFTRVETAR